MTLPSHFITKMVTLYGDFILYKILDSYYKNIDLLVEYFKDALG